MVRMKLKLIEQRQEPLSLIDNFNSFSSSLKAEDLPGLVCDEYGGHNDGRREKNGKKLKPSRSTMRNDEVCRDAFNLHGPFDVGYFTETQKDIRRDLLERIQTSIMGLRFTFAKGLDKFDVLEDMDRADTREPGKCCEYASAVCCSLWLPGGNVAAYTKTLSPKQH
jgi:hypothetical protein